jgi:hypothetical protein
MVTEVTSTDKVSLVPIGVSKLTHSVILGGNPLNYHRFSHSPEKRFVKQSQTRKRPPKSNQPCFRSSRMIVKIQGEMFQACQIDVKIDGRDVKI